MIPGFTKAQWDQIWQRLAKTKTFKGSESKESSLKDLALHMYHYILAINLFGKKDNNTISQTKLYILCVMVLKQKLNFSAFMVAHLKNVLVKSQ